MIVRLWFSRTTRDRADEFEAYLVETGGQDIPQTPGNAGVYLLRLDQGDVVRFGVISLWESEAAISGFAGQDVTAVRYYPQDHALLLDFPEHAEHFRVVSQRARSDDSGTRELKP